MKRLSRFLLGFVLALAVLLGAVIGVAYWQGYGYIVEAFADQAKRREAFIPLFERMPSSRDFKTFDNQVVRAGVAEPWQEADDYNSSQLTAADRAYLEEYETRAYLIIKDGHIFFEEYWFDLEQDALHGSFSMAKSIVSMLIGIAIEEGHIAGLEADMADLLPNYNDAMLRGIPLRDVLSMASGLSLGIDDYVSPFSIMTRAYYGHSFHDIISHIERKRPTGEFFEYTDIQTLLLGAVLQETTGMPVSEYASQKLWQPLHAEHDALWSFYRQDGYQKAFCCFTATARDYARLGQLVLQAGRWNDVQLVPETYLQEATQARSDINYLDSDEANHIYGYQFWRLRILPDNATHIREVGAYFAGHRGQYIITAPKENMVVVRVGNADPDGFPTIDLYHIAERLVAGE